MAARVRGRLWAFAVPDLEREGCTVFPARTPRSPVRALIAYGNGRTTVAFLEPYLSLTGLLAHYLDAFALSASPDRILYYIPASLSLEAESRGDVPRLEVRKVAGALDGEAVHPSPGTHGEVRFAIRGGVPR